MRKKLLWSLAIVLAVGLGLSSVAGAVSTTLRAGNLILTVGGDISPRKLPRHKYVPITSHIFGKIKTSDGTHPSAFRELALNVDKDFRINVKGFPAVCKRRQLEARDTKTALRVCGKALIGRGHADAGIRFPEQPEIKVSSPLLVFNGGEKGGKVKLLVHTFITVPAPAAIVTDVTITRSGSGIKSIAKIPVIAGGSGSALDFDFKLGRTYRYRGKQVGYFEARCPDGVFKVSSPKALFKNETHEPGVAAQTILKGSVALPCTPKG